MDTETGAPPSVNDVDKKIIGMLNGLIHVCHEGYDGYMKAAEGINSAAYKTMFAEYALQRGRFASQLGTLVEDYGGDADDDGHAMNLFLHGWTNIVPVLMGGDHGAIFAECERSEGVAINAYEHCMEMTIPKDISEVIRQQYEQVMEAQARLHNLHQAYALEHRN